MCAAGNMQTQQPLMNNEELRIVLVGKTGVGKSATGNTILGKKVFKSDIFSSSVTSECEKARGTVDGRKVAIIDTPGIFDTRFSEEVVIEKIKLCMSLCAPGPHMFLVNIQLGRFTQEEQKTLEIIKGIFGNASLRYTMVLFTHGDQLKKSRKTIHEFVNGSRELLKFIQSSSGQYHVFNNDDEDRAQVTALLEKINQVVVKNGGQHYTNEMLQMAERAIQQKTIELQRNQRLSILEARNRAEGNNSFLDMDWGTIVTILGALAAGALAIVAKVKCTIQ